MKSVSRQFIMDKIINRLMSMSNKYIAAIYYELYGDEIKWDKEKCRWYYCE